ncbi:hypothetical protein HDK77DRAFT_21213 [Phyllosticta capitalensis]
MIDVRNIGLPVCLLFWLGLLYAPMSHHNHHTRRLVRTWPTSWYFCFFRPGQSESGLTASPGALESFFSSHLVETRSAVSRGLASCSARGIAQTRTMGCEALKHGRHVLCCWLGQPGLDGNP